MIGHEKQDWDSNPDLMFGAHPPVEQGRLSIRHYPPGCQTQFCRAYRGCSPARTRLLSEGLEAPSAGSPVSATNHRQPAATACFPRAAMSADCAPRFWCDGNVAPALSDPTSPST